MRVQTYAKVSIYYKQVEAAYERPHVNQDFSILERGRIVKEYGQRKLTLIAENLLTWPSRPMMRPRAY